MRSGGRRRSTPPWMKRGNSTWGRTSGGWRFSTAGGWKPRNGCKARTPPSSGTRWRSTGSCSTSSTTRPTIFWWPTATSPSASSGGTRPISRARRPKSGSTTPWSAWGLTGRSGSSPPPLRGERKISSRICRGTAFSRTETARENFWIRTLRKDSRSMWTPCRTCSITRTTLCGPGPLCGISEEPMPRRKSGTSWSRRTRCDTRRRTSRRPSCGTRGSCPTHPRRPMRTYTRPWSSMWRISTRPSKT